jgi:membrane protease YdiL (CAAX protease family)
LSTNELYIYLAVAIGALMAFVIPYMVKYEKILKEGGAIPSFSIGYIVGFVLDLFAVMLSIAFVLALVQMPEGEDVVVTLGMLLTWFLFGMGQARLVALPIDYIEARRKRIIAEEAANKA